MSEHRMRLMVWAEEADRPRKKGKTVDGRAPALPNPRTESPDVQPVDALKVGVAYRLIHVWVLVSTFIRHLAIGLHCRLCEESIFPALSTEAERRPGRLSVASCCGRSRRACPSPQEERRGRPGGASAGSLVSRLMHVSRWSDIVSLK